MPDKAVATSPRIQELTRQLRQSPRPRTVLELAKAYQEAGELGEAARVCREGLEKQPGHHSARVLLGKILLKQEEFGGAADELGRVVSEAPDNLMARRLLGQAQEGAGRIQPALATYQELLTLLPGDAEVEGRVAALQSAADAPAPPPAPAPPEPPMPAQAGFETLDLAQDEPETEDEAAAEPEAVAAPFPDAEAGPVPPTTAMEAPELEAPPEGGTIPPTAAMQAPEVEGAQADEAPAGAAPEAGTAQDHEEARQEGGAAGEAPPVPRTVAMDPSELGLGEIDDDQPTQAIDAFEMKPPAEGAPAQEPGPEPPVPAAEAPPIPEEAGTVMMQAPAFGDEPIPEPEPGPEPAPAAERIPSAEEAAGREEVPGDGEEGGALPTPTLAELYVEQGMPGKAVEVYERLLQGDPGNAELRQRLAALKGEESPARRRIQALEGWLRRIQRSRDAQGRA